MKPRQFSCLLGMLCACLAPQSCLDTKTPLPSPEKAKPDAVLVGVWRASDGGLIFAGGEYVHVGRAGGKLPEGVMRAVVVGHDKEDGTVDRPVQWLIFVTLVGENRYLNAARIENQDVETFDQKGWQPDLVKGWNIVKYQVQGDSLLVWMMDPEVKDRLIRAGKIKGTVSKGDAAFFTDTPENVAALLAKPENADLFGNKELLIRYQRVK